MLREPSAKSPRAGARLRPPRTAAASGPRLNPLREERRTARPQVGPLCREASLLAPTATATPQAPTPAAHRTHTPSPRREGRAGAARPHSLGFLAPSLPAGSWWTSTPAPPRSSTARRSRVQHIWRVASVLRDSAPQSGAALGKSQSFAPRGSAGRDAGTCPDTKRAPPPPPRDFLRGLRSITVFPGSTAVPPLSGPSEETELWRRKERVRWPPRERPRDPQRRGAEAERAERAAASRNRSLPAPPLPRRRASNALFGGRSRQFQRESKLFFFFLKGRNRKGKVKGKLDDSRLAWTVARVNRTLAGEEVGGQG